jgi:hypothetical protein
LNSETALADFPEERPAPSRRPSRTRPGFDDSDPVSRYGQSGGQVSFMQWIAGSVQ